MLKFKNCNVLHKINKKKKSLNFANVAQMCLWIVQLGDNDAIKKKVLEQYTLSGTLQHHTVAIQQ